jgi:uncharacterized integral membrane protein
MPTSHKPRISGRPGYTGRTGPASRPTPSGPRFLERREPRLAPRAVTATRTGVVWGGLWTVAVIVAAFMVLVVSNTGDVRLSFAGMSGVLPLAVVLMVAMAAGIAVALIMGTARLTQLRPLTRKRLR